MQHAPKIECDPSPSALRQEGSDRGAMFQGYFPSADHSRRWDLRKRRNGRHTASVQDSFIPLASLRPPTARRAGGNMLPRCAPTPRCHHPNISSASSGLTALLSSWRAQADNLLQLQSFTHSLSRCQAHRHSRQRSHFILLSPAQETNSAT